MSRDVNLLYVGKVTGISFPEASKNFKAIVTILRDLDEDAIDPVIEIRAEPENKYDPNAIAVYMAQRGDDLLRIGYIPALNTGPIHEVGVENCDVEIAKLNEMDGVIKGVDIMVLKRMVK